MYGFVLEGIAQTIRCKYGDDIWKQICDAAVVKHKCFKNQKMYSETLVPRLAKAASDITGESQEDLLHRCGLLFIGYTRNNGYERVMRVLGRHLRDFINGLDNLHEYLRFTYPKIKPPSFFCENESKTGMTLHYRSKRTGFLPYVAGQIEAVASGFYDTTLKISILSKTESLGHTHVIMQLDFNNSAYSDCLSQTPTKDVVPSLVSHDVLYDVFPFHIFFDASLMILAVGSALANIMPDAVGQALDETFSLIRPNVGLSIKNIQTYRHNIFEMMSIEPASRQIYTEVSESSQISLEEREYPLKLRVRGQMEYLEECDAFIFLATPIMESLDSMYASGLYLNDLSMHDSSRELVLAGTQQQADLKMELVQEQQRSARLEESMRRVDEELQRTDKLLYQMIPKSVADRLRKGEPAINTCQTFESVTILFTDVVGFTKICSAITPMEVVTILNNMYTTFDRLTVKHNVYKVETIGDAYMVVSGAPLVTKFHAVYVSDLAFDMTEAMTKMADPVNPGSHMKIRLGMHTGPVVAGAVGIKMPRYCLLGETVTIANRMESTGQAMRIHISETTKNHIQGNMYRCEMAGPMEVKSGGLLNTYWLVERRSGAAARPLRMSDDLDSLHELNIKG